MKKTVTPKSFLLLALIFIVKINFAQWNSNPAINTPVITETGNQIDLSMNGDGHGGAFIVWKDYRAGLPDIYIQRMNAAGYPLWDTNGVAIVTDPADQSTPTITTDMTGGAIVAFSDWRSGIERDVYAQRIDSLGVVQWMINGVGIANTNYREHAEQIISDGEGGAIIIWEKQVGGQWDIWAQRVSHTGVLLWAVGGIPICTVNANRINPKIKKDGRGGAFIAWQDYRNFTDYNIYAQRLSPSGNLLWGGNGIAICMAVGPQYNPKVEPDSASGGITIAWGDKRNLGDADIYAQKIDSTGTILWANDGVPVCNLAGSQSAVDMLSTPSTNGTIFSWKDQRSGNYDIYAQRLDLNGAPQWALNGIPVCTSIYDQLNPNLVDDHAGGVIIVWQDSSFVDWDVKSQRINNSGVVQWATNGVLVSSATGPQTSPKNISDGTGGAIYAWQDKRNAGNGSASDIYAHHLFSDGTTNMGISESMLNATFSVSPNPFSDNFTVYYTSSSEQKISISVTNLLGQSMPVTISDGVVQSSTKHSFNITTSNLPKGIYFVTLSTKENSKTIKLVKS